MDNNKVTRIIIDSTGQISGKIIENWNNYGVVQSKDIDLHLKNNSNEKIEEEVKSDRAIKGSQEQDFAEQVGSVARVAVAASLS